MAMRKARKERRSAGRRRQDSYEVKFAKCAGKCEMQVTKLLTDPITPEIKADAANPNAFAQQGDATQAANGLKARIVRWAAPVDLDPPCKAGCQCTEIEEIDWDKKKTHTRTFSDPFTSQGKKFRAEVEISFKVAIVTGACLEPPNQPI